MKKFCYALACATLLPIAAAAQSSVTLYGIADAGIEHVNKQVGGGSVTRVVSGGESGSRLGFRGVEDLGGGLRALFSLESGLNIDDGTLAQGGRLFGRSAFVGLSGGFGQLTLGRHITVANDYGLQFEPLGRPTRFSAGAVDAAYAGRVDNSVRYQYVAGVNRIVGLYGLGEVAGSSRAGRYMGAFGTTKLGNAALGFGYEEQAGATVALVRDEVKRTMFGIDYNFGPVIANAGYTDRRNDVAAAPTRLSQYWVGLRGQLAPQWYAAAAYYVSDVKNSDNKGELLSVLVTYAFSRRTDVYLHVATSRNDARSNLGVIGFGTVPAGESQQGVILGVRHTF